MNLKRPIFGRVLLEMLPKAPVQTDVTLLANNSQYCWMLRVASVCAPCRMLLLFVGSCCAKFETGQSFTYVQMDATTPFVRGLGLICSLMDAGRKRNFLTQNYS